jgi:citronellol/citronellal dehydrogenase
VAPSQALAGRRALVTGASRGIGAAVAEALAAEGADVAVVARSLDHHPKLQGSLRDTAARIEARGTAAAVVVADLADSTDRERIVGEATTQLGGPIDVLVNNAAAAIYQPLATYPLRRARLTLELNVVAPLQLAQDVVPAMVERGEGWIVNVSSATARPVIGPPFATGATGSTVGVYGASKAALNRLSNALAAELWGTGVRVNTLEPRAAVMTEGATVLVGDIVTDDMIEPMETMVAATLYLCRCEEDETGGAHISLSLIKERGLQAG